VALVTGAGRRIGRSIALRLASEGARIALHYRNSESEANAVAAEIAAGGGEAVCLHAELTHTDEIASLFERTEQQFGRLDILVNNAAVFAATSLAETTDAQWDAILNTNLKAQFFCAQRGAPLLARTGHGRIVNLASLGGLLAWPKFTAYCVSKAGVIMLTRCLARALAPSVTVNAIAPGTISFPNDPPELADLYVQRTPMGRTGGPEDIADAVMYFVGAGFVTGQILTVDGGRSIPS
jgi:NAD(P)-dependent dehydrogenase (short-subunit alcohol dehydrogenase family)